jgi:hypothetical protein
MTEEFGRSAIAGWRRARMGREISSIALYLRVSALGIIETLNIIESMIQVHFGSKADIG